MLIYFMVVLNKTYIAIVLLLFENKKKKNGDLFSERKQSFCFILIRNRE